jgi:hypothetical protein
MGTVKNSRRLTTEDVEKAAVNRRAAVTFPAYEAASVAVPDRATTLAIRERAQMSIQIARHGGIKHNRARVPAMSRPPSKSFAARSSALR